jgi:hypothetical protein
MCTKSIFFNFDFLGVGLKIDKPSLYARLDYNLYRQCRTRWMLLLRNVNFLHHHKRMHNMKRLIRCHVHFNKCRTQVAALYTASSLHNVRFFPHTLCSKQCGLQKHASAVRDVLCTLPAFLLLTGPRLHSTQRYRPLAA